MSSFFNAMNYITILNYTTGEVLVTKLPYEYENIEPEFIESIFGNADCEYMVTNDLNLIMKL